MTTGELDTLGRAWMEAEAVLPRGWALVDLRAYGSDSWIPTAGGAVPVARPRHWFVSAEGDPRTRDRIEAGGTTPTAALNNLATKLLALRGDRNG